MGITVLLADSVVGVRQIERNLLEQEPDIEIVGEAADEPEAMMLIKSVEPQIVVTDFNVRSTGKIFARTKVLGVTELKGKYVKNFVKIFRAEPGFLPFGRRRVLPGSSPRAWRIVGPPSLWPVKVICSIQPGTTWVCIRPLAISVRKRASIRAEVSTILME